MKFGHVTFVGVNQVNAEKVLWTLALIAFVVAARYGLNFLVRQLRRIERTDRLRFWAHQGINLAATAFFIVALISIWVGPHSHWATVGGLIGAGIAFALQQFIIAIAGYFVLLRGKHYSLGDRIIIGGVRGEVIALDFIQTTVLEMGQPPSVESGADPAMWVMARQYTGRIVVVSNGQIFTQPVYNYSRDFPFIWEEIAVGVGYSDNYGRAEQILLEVARVHALDTEHMSLPSIEHLHKVYNLSPPDVKERVFYRMTPNWVELTLRFIVPDRGIRQIKDAMYRDILRRFGDEHITIASGTYDIVGLPPIRLAGMETAVQSRLAPEKRPAENPPDGSV